ncbi:jg20810 [Pararge aegeria aegeria]|uniref:Jg20810 protein n=1 Tax=Pararge aegeria aegeria TaxID=348720 RepID=A0A8S4R9Y3_9NEOP|nr:jg20810 [Pararge aegeria aegeria]
MLLSSRNKHGDNSNSPGELCDKKLYCYRILDWKFIACQFVLFSVIGNMTLGLPARKNGRYNGFIRRLRVTQRAMRELFFYSRSNQKRGSQRFAREL